MLVLTRRIEEKIVIGADIYVTIVSIEGGKVRLGIEAPKSVCVDRQEVHQRRTEFSETPVPQEVAAP